MPVQCNQRDSSMQSVTAHHVKYEHQKCQGCYIQECQYIQANFISQQYALLLPITFDPRVLIGPLASTFLWKPSTAPSSTLATHSHNMATPFINYSISTYTHAAFLCKSDAGWSEQSGSLWFTRSQSALSPSQWFQQVLGVNLVLAFSRHLYTQLTQHRALHSQSTFPSPTFLATAVILPRHTNPTYALLPHLTFYPLLTLYPISFLVF